MDRGMSQAAARHHDYHLCRGAGAKDLYKTGHLPQIRRKCLSCLPVQEPDQHDVRHRGGVNETVSEGIFVNQSLSCLKSNWIWKQGLAVVTSWNSLSSTPYSLSHLGS